MRELKRYTLPLILGTLALVGVTIGILATTVWRPQQQVVATGETDQPFTMTRAGVLRLYEPHQEVAGVRVEASVPGDSLVWLATGSEEDINAWLQDEAYDEIIGLSDLETLKVITHEAAEQPDEEEATEEEPQAEEEAAEESGSEEDAQSGEEPAENPIASDMWTAVKYGRHSVSLELTGDELDQSLLAATDGEGPAPVIRLSWETPQANALALWSYVSAGVLAALALITAAVITARRKKGESTLQIEAPAKAPKQTEEIEAPALIDAGTSTQEPETGETQAVVDAGPEPVETQAEAVEPEALERETVDISPVAEVEPEVIEVEEETQEELPRYPVAGPIGAVTGQVPKVAPEPPADSGSLEEVVTTESGMMNLAALQAGRGFPSRRALREAEKRGVEALVVDGRRYETGTGEIPVVPDAPEDALKRRGRGPLSWSQMVEGSTDKNSDADPSQGD